MNCADSGRLAAAAMTIANRPSLNEIMARLLPHRFPPESLISRGLQAGPGQEAFKPGGFWATFLMWQTFFLGV
jgi:hypothetical protein